MIYFCCCCCAAPATSLVMCKECRRVVCSVECYVAVATMDLHTGCKGRFGRTFGLAPPSKKDVALVDSWLSLSEQE